MTRDLNSLKNARYDVVDIRGHTLARDLALQDAVTLVFRSPRGSGVFTVPIAYRSPTVSLGQAQAAARHELERAAAANEVAADQSVEFHSDHPMYYTFLLPVAKWRKQGRLPGGLICSIDKLDSDVWTREDKRTYGEMTGR